MEFRYLVTTQLLAMSNRLKKMTWVNDGTIKMQSKFLCTINLKRND